VNKGRLIGLITKHELATPHRLYLLRTGGDGDGWRRVFSFSVHNLLGNERFDRKIIIIVAEILFDCTFP